MTIHLSYLFHIHDKYSLYAKHELFKMIQNRLPLGGDHLFSIALNQQTPHPSQVSVMLLLKSSFDLSMTLIWLCLAWHI